MKLLKYFMLICILGLIIIYNRYFKFDEEFWKTIMSSGLISLFFIFISTFVIEKFINKDNEQFNEKEFFEITAVDLLGVLYGAGSLIDGVYNSNPEFPIPHMDSLREMVNKAQYLSSQRSSNYDEEYMFQMYLDIYIKSSEGKDEEILLVTEKQYLVKLKSVNDEIDNYLKVYASIAPKKHLKEILELKGNLTMLYAVLPKETDGKMIELIEDRMIFMGKIALIVLNIELERNNNTNSKLFGDSFFRID